MQTIGITDASGATQQVGVYTLPGGEKVQVAFLGEMLWTPIATSTAGQRKFTVSTTAVALNPPAGALFAQVAIEAADVVYRDDGGTPTASDGNGYLTAGYSVIVKIPTLANFKMIRKGAVDAVAWVGFYSYG
jgi:hypothetical protein